MKHLLATMLLLSISTQAQQTSEQPKPTRQAGLREAIANAIKYAKLDEKTEGPKLPTLSAALAEAMTQSPQVKAGTAKLRSLKTSRIGGLLGLVNSTYSKTKTVGNLSAGEYLLPVDGNSRNSGWNVTIAPAAILAYFNMGNVVKAGEQSLLSVQQGVGIELIRAWMEFYRLQDTIDSLTFIQGRIDEVAKDVIERSLPTKEEDLAKLSGFKSKLSIQIGALTRNLRMAKIDYRTIMGTDPLLPKNEKTPPKESRDIDEEMRKVKEGLDQVFSLPSFDEAVALTLLNNPDLVAADYTVKANNTDSWASRIMPFVPNLTISDGNIFNIGGPPGGLPPGVGATIKQKTYTLSIGISLGDSTKAISEALNHIEAVQNREVARRQALANIEKIYIGLETIDQTWLAQVERFKSAVKQLETVPDRAANVTNALLALEEQLDAWAGPSGFASLTTDMIATRASAHAHMGTLFQEIEELKKLENGSNPL